MNFYTTSLLQNDPTVCSYYQVSVWRSDRLLRLDTWRERELYTLSSSKNWYVSIRKYLLRPFTFLTHPQSTCPSKDVTKGCEWGRFGSTIYAGKSRCGLQLHLTWDVLPWTVPSLFPECNSHVKHEWFDTRDRISFFQKDYGRFRITFDVREERVREIKTWRLSLHKFGLTRSI